uniref:Uncharacterized protein n=1 Tax=Oryza glumipatula TaxID=40148 RepID=A0A0D9ZMR0_9ORYZ
MVGCFHIPRVRRRDPVGGGARSSDSASTRSAAASGPARSGGGRRPRAEAAVAGPWTWQMALAGVVEPVVCSSPEPTLSRPAGVVAHRCKMYPEMAEEVTITQTVVMGIAPSKGYNSKGHY